METEIFAEEGIGVLEQVDTAAMEVTSTRFVNWCRVLCLC